MASCQRCGPVPPYHGDGGVFPTSRRLSLRSSHEPWPDIHYDRSRPLVLDPSVIVYAGYIGGAGDDVANGIALDSATNTYVVGPTTSTVPSFPVTVGPDLIFNGGTDAYVAKVRADGSGSCTSATSAGRATTSVGESRSTRRETRM